MRKQSLEPTRLLTRLVETSLLFCLLGILFEVIRTLNSFHPEIVLTLCQFKDKSRNPLLIIPKFATSSNQNLKYLGISMLCQVHPNAWSDAWWNDSLLAAVVDALESRDTTIQRRALELLYRMLTLENSENIIDRLVHAFYLVHDEHREQEIHREQELFGYDHRRVTRDGPASYREKILGQILDAAERFGKSEEKYLDLMVDLLGRGGSTVTMQTAERIMLVLDKGKWSPWGLAASETLSFLQSPLFLLSRRQKSCDEYNPFADASCPKGVGLSYRTRLQSSNPCIGVLFVLGTRRIWPGDRGGINGVYHGGSWTLSFNKSRYVIT